MQTFVPWPDVYESARSLDNKRLNKQLLEGRQIYKILATNQKTGGWVNHPAVNMWRNYDNALFFYLNAIKIECTYRDISTEKNWGEIMRMHEMNYFRGTSYDMPPWWGDQRVHLSHRQNLFNKDPEYYAFFTEDAHLSAVSCCDTCNYFWPSHVLMYNGELLESFQYIKS